MPKLEAAPRRSIGARRNPATEAAVLDAAEAILREEGPKALTMDAVARRARAGKATLYRWWPSRGALLVAVYERIKGEHPHADTGALESDLAAFFDFVLGFWSEGHGVIFAHIIAEAQSDEGVAEALDAYRLDRQAALVPVLERARARGELAPTARPEALAEQLVALLWYLLLTRRLDRPGAEVAAEVVSAWGQKNRQTAR